MVARRLSIPLLLLALLVGGSAAAWLVIDHPARPNRAALASRPGAAETPSDAAVEEPELRASREPTLAAAARRPAARVEPLPVYPIERAKADLVVEVDDGGGRSIRDVSIELRST